MTNEQHLLAFNYAPQECEASSYLESWRPPANDHDQSRIEEPWLASHEKCLVAWGSEWKTLAEQHSKKEESMKWYHKLLQIPNVLIPIGLAPILASKLVQENNPYLIFALIVSGISGGLMPILSLEKKAEQHSQAEFRYRDMLTDLEALLAQERKYRTRCDVTMQSFKMRMDMAAKISPPVPLPRAADEEWSE